jgi:hypothetical protein
LSDARVFACFAFFCKATRIFLSATRIFLSANILEHFDGWKKKESSFGNQFTFGNFWGMDNFVQASEFLESVDKEGTWKIALKVVSGKNLQRKYN